MRELEDRIGWEGRRGDRREGKGGEGGTGKNLRVLLRPRLWVRDPGNMFQMANWLRRQQTRLLTLWAARVPEGRGGSWAGDAKGGMEKEGGVVRGWGCGCRAVVW